MTTQKIIYFEYGGKMNCHYNPQQDGINIETFLNNLRIFRDGDDIRVDWHNRYITMNYTGGDQLIKVYEEEREWDNAGNSTQKSYKLVKSLDVPVYQGTQPIISQPVHQGPASQPKPPKGISTPPHSRPTTPRPSKSMSHIDELKRKQAQGKTKPSDFKKKKE